MGRRLICILLITLIGAVSMTAASAAGTDDKTGFSALVTGELTGPVNISFSSPAFGKIAQFGKDRVSALNRLLQHISIEIGTDGNSAGATVSVDEEPLFTVYEKNDNENIKTICSFGPGQCYSITGRQADEPSFATFLERDFFRLNRILDESYILFDKMPDAFPEFVKQGTSGISYKGYGKAVKKAIIQFTAEYVRDHFPQVPAETAKNEELMHFLKDLVFQGSQRITLQYNADSQLMSVSYSGTVGLTEDSLRKVSLTWKCLRSEAQIRDSISFKSPSVKGYDKYNFTFERDICNHSETTTPLISWDYQLDQKEADLKRKMAYNGEVSMSDPLITGHIQYTEKQNGQEYKLMFVHEMKKENSQSYRGTIEITAKKDKIELCSVKSLLHIFSDGNVAIQNKEDAQTDPDIYEGNRGEDILQGKLYSTIIRKLITLPSSDIEFLKQDIPENLWNSIIQRLYQQETGQ